MGLDPGVFGRFDLAALQPHLKFLFVCLFTFEIYVSVRLTSLRRTRWDLKPPT